VETICVWGLKSSAHQNRNLRYFLPGRTSKLFLKLLVWAIGVSYFWNCWWELLVWAISEHVGVSTTYRKLNHIWQWPIVWSFLQWISLNKIGTTICIVEWIYVYYFVFRQIISAKYCHIKWFLRLMSFDEFGRLHSLLPTFWVLKPNIEMDMCNVFISAEYVTLVVWM